MSIKTASEEWVRKGPVQALAVIAVAGLVVGGALGLGAGYSIEQNRTHAGVKRLEKQIKAGGGGGPTAVTGILGQRVGTVTAVASGAVTVDTKQRGEQTLQTSAETLFETTVKGKVADVESGRRVLVTRGGDEVILLTPESKMGRVVSAVTSSSISIAAGNGAPGGTLKISAVHAVETVKASTIAAVKTGSDILAGGKAATKSVFTTVEIIVLPKGSRFAG